MDHETDRPDPGMTEDSDSSIEIADPFARRLLTQYLERRRSDLDRLRAALTDSDYASIERTGHNLFGSGAAYGLEPISVLGADLEQAAKYRQPDRIRQLIDQLDNFVTNLTVT